MIIYVTLLWRVIINDHFKNRNLQEKYYFLFLNVTSKSTLELYVLLWFWVKKVNFLIVLQVPGKGLKLIFLRRTMAAT